LLCLGFAHSPTQLID
ncbi:hypothetical protein D018_3552B, partial [Vibrio parahaemolyticus VP2007-007]